MKILTINSGSTSIKFKLFEMPQEKLIAYGKVEEIGLEHSKLSFWCASHEEESVHSQISNHRKGFALIIKRLTDPTIKIIRDTSEIDAIGHRVVHAGEKLSHHSIINEEILGFIRDCIELAPLHNPPNLTGIEVCMEIFANTPNIAVFDNNFHKDIPQKAYLYGLPYEYYLKYRIRKYGFHGIAYTYMIKRLSELLQEKYGSASRQDNVIAIMLGGGSSITAVKSGISTDTSMGFTPAEGLIMSTRCGDIDPALIPYLMKKEGLDIAGIDSIINKKSGILGLSTKYSNFKQMQDGMLSGDEDCQRAFDAYVYRIKKYIGAYTAAMNGLDAIVFSGGIGEKSAILRESVLGKMDFLGIQLDKDLNGNLESEGIISGESSKVKVAVVNVDEEVVIARQTYGIVKDTGGPGK